MRNRIHPYALRGPLYISPSENILRDFWKLRKIIVISILLVFLMFPLMLVGVNEVAAQGMGGGGGGGSAGGGAVGGKRDYDRTRIVAVEVTVTVKVISQVTHTIPVGQVINQIQPAPTNAPAPGPPQTPPATAIEYALLAALLAIASIVIETKK